MNVNKQEYVKNLKVKQDYKKLTINFFKSFLFGGTICLFGQFLLYLYTDVLKIDTTDAKTYMICSVILIASILSVLGVYDKLGQIGRSGMSIPISGFANSMVSSAMEFRPEGFILGIGANTFKLAGTVIVLGTFSAIIVAIIRFIFGI